MVGSSAEYSGSHNDWGPYASLTGAVVMDVDDGLEFGAFLRAETAAFVEYGDVIEGSFAVTFGLSIGFDVLRGP